MNDNINEIQDKVYAANRFKQKYGDQLVGEGHFIELTVETSALYISKSACALAGEVFGRDGWTRHVCYNRFDWKKDVDGIHVTISDAEELDVDKTPVPPSMFPLELTTPPPPLLSPEDDEIPF